MITEAIVILKMVTGHNKSYRMQVKDSLGIEVGKSYFLNLDGRTCEWQIAEIEVSKEHRPS